jgi:predicted MFS family arabinose efflux permease
LSATVLSRLPRRALLVGLIALLAGSACASGLAHGFGALLAPRLAEALAHGAFWAFIGSIAIKVVPERKIGRATAIIFGDVSAAGVFGVPLVNYMEADASWWTAFYGSAGLTVGGSVTAARMWRNP